MEQMIYNPLEEYEKRFRQQHQNATEQFFNDLVQRSAVDPDQNRETIRQHGEFSQTVAKLRRKYNWLRFLRVVMCITILLIPLVIWKITPKIRALREEIQSADQRVAQLYQEAVEQMRPLNALFTEQDALQLVEDTIPLLDFAPEYTCEQAMNMAINYDFVESESYEESALDVLAGHYNDNPFLYEKKRVHTLGMHTYHGQLTITWTETYRDSKGRICRRTRSQTLHASVTKPCPFYHTKVVLNYCAQGGPELSFSRDADHVEQKSDRALERHVKRGEKTLKKKESKADGDFTAMSNTDFEVLFDALNRDHEVQFRTLFTPLAQTNMVDLLRSPVGFGDNFHFIKRKRTNQVVAEHSQGKPLRVPPQAYQSHAFDVIRENFLQENAAFFKKVYFEFAPLLAIPIYQERPVHSLEPIPDYSQTYTSKVCEALTNKADRQFLVHPNTRTEAILKASYVGSSASVDEFQIDAYSYDKIPRVDYVSVYGGDGRFHNVPVHWDEYIPLQFGKRVFVAAAESISGTTEISERNGIHAFTV